MRELDNYAVHYGNHYPVSKQKNDLFRLRSNNSEDIKNGFIVYTAEMFKKRYGFIPPHEKFGDTFIKEVTRDEIEAAYRLRTFARYKGYDFKGNEFIVFQEKDDKYLIGTGDYNLYKELDFTFRDRGDYIKWVDKDEVELWEVMDPLLDFPLPEKNTDNEKDEDKI